MSCDHFRLRQAVFERVTTREPYEKITEKHNVSQTRLKLYTKKWETSNPSTMPKNPSKLHVSVKSVGRPTVLTPEEEDLFCDVEKHYIDAVIPLTRQEVLEIVQDVYKLLLSDRQNEISFQNGRPSLKWLECFLKRHPLFVLLRAHETECKRVKALTAENVGVHIARLQALMFRYKITKARQVYNLDETGILFRPTGKRSRRKALGRKGQRLLTMLLRTRNIDHVTVMSVVNAAGQKRKPIVAYPGVNQRYRKIVKSANRKKPSVEAVQDNLMDAYFHQRDPAGVDSVIFAEWVDEFILEIREHHPPNEKVMLIFDCYTCQIQYRVLQRLFENGIIAATLPAHNSHVLQPLDVSVFSPFKSAHERNFSTASRATKQLDAFCIARCIKDAYERSHVGSNREEDFEITGIWIPEVGGASVVPLRTLPFYSPTAAGKRALPTVDEVVNEHRKRARAFVRKEDVTEAWTVRINTTRGAHVTGAAVRETLRVEEARREEAKRRVDERAAERMERRDEELRQKALARHRSVQRACLKYNRKERREAARKRTAWLQIARQASLEFPLEIFLPASDAEEQN